MSRTRAALVWAGLLIVLTVPLATAATSPLLAWRQPIYIMACFAGIAAMALLVLQPLLAEPALPGILPRQGRRFHRWTGALVTVLVLLHLGGLWLTSPPDVVDAMLFASPTPFSAWGVIAFWGILATVGLALWRKRLGLRRWKQMHLALTSGIVLCSILHAMLIDGTMEPLSKIGLCVVVAALTFRLLLRQRPRVRRQRQRP